MAHIFSSFFCLSTSYKRFIPESLNHNIKQRNFLTRIRINNVFKKFLSEFNSRTMKDSDITPYDLKIKYLATLEGLTSGLGSELIEPVTLSVTHEGELSNGGYHGKSLNADFKFWCRWSKVFFLFESNVVIIV